MFSILSELNLWLFLIGNNIKEKITTCETTTAAEAGKVWENSRNQKKKKIKQYFKTKPSAINLKDLKSFILNLLHQVLPPLLIVGSQKELFIHLSFSQPNILDCSSPATLSPFEKWILDHFCQFSCVKKPTKN